MAVLEYLTQNSLIAYPFKGRRAVYTPDSYKNPTPIQDDWFYDILFTSFTKRIRSVFISALEKTEAGDLYIILSNVETPAVIARLAIPSSELVNHHNNTEKSFAAVSTADFAVKFVFGPGLVVQVPFSQEYTVEEAELDSSAIILGCPRLDRLTFKTYDSDLIELDVDIIPEEPYQGDGPFLVKSFTAGSGETPLVSLRYNSEFILEGVNHGGLHAGKALGSGLYDNCPVPGNITDVYAINATPPNAAGALFFNPSNCYTANVLTASDEILLGNYLTPYRAEYVYNNAGELIIKDVVSVGHSLVLQNYCKPKCAPEDMNAFAYYLNRITDGVRELNSVAFNNAETLGLGTASLRVFTASQFCSTTDTTFLRCVDPKTDKSSINCNSRFIKNFHEGRTLKIAYTDLTLKQAFIITEVSDDGWSVTLNDAPSATGVPTPFKVIDNGVLSNMNCAASAYNAIAAAYTAPYFKVKYTTSEAYSPSGVYVTYISVAVALFNPSINNVVLQLTFNAANLTQQGNIKIRKNDGISIVTSPVVHLSCRQYAFVEIVYYIPCNTFGGNLTIDAWDITNNTTQIGSTYTLPTIDGVECPGTLTGLATTIRVTQTYWSTFYAEIALPTAVTSVTLPFYGNPAPSWLTATPDYNNHKIVLRASSAPTEVSSIVYTLSFRSYGGNVPGAISQLVVDYVAHPVVIAPVTGNYTEQSPLLLSRELVYDADTPVLQVSATNMHSLLDYYGDEASYLYTYYAPDGLPPGLTFDVVAGKLIGQLDADLAIGTLYTLLIGAANPAGQSTTQEVILKISE